MWRTPYLCGPYGNENIYNDVYRILVRVFCKGNLGVKTSEII